MKTQTEKTYIVADLQDLTNKEYHTMDGAKRFLINIWDEMDLEDTAHLERINAAESIEELDSMLRGVDYAIFQTEEDYTSFTKQKIYKIEVLNKGSEISDFRDLNFSLDKDNFKDLVYLVDCVNEILSEISLRLKDGLDFVTLKIHHEEHILFETLESYNEFTKKYNMEPGTRSDFSQVLYVNGIEFKGEIEEGMLLQEV